MGLGKILEGRWDGVLIKLCLLIHGPGFVPLFPLQGPLDEALKVWCLSILIFVCSPALYSPAPVLHANQGLLLPHPSAPTPSPT